MNQKLALVIKSGKYRLGKLSVPLCINHYSRLSHGLSACEAESITYHHVEILISWILGYKSAIKALRLGQSKLIIISNNCPAIRRTELEYYAMLSKSQVHHFDGNNVELGKW